MGSHKCSCRAGSRVQRVLGSIRRVAFLCMWVVMTASLAFSHIFSISDNIGGKVLVYGRIKLWVKASIHPRRFQEDQLDLQCGKSKYRECI
jgi:hypothetical protein